MTKCPMCHIEIDHLLFWGTVDKTWKFSPCTKLFMGVEQVRLPAREFHLDDFPSRIAINAGECG